MNISGISFGNDNIKFSTFDQSDFEQERLEIPNVFGGNNTPLPNGSHVKKVQKDSFESSKKTADKKKKKGGNIFRNRVMSFVLGVATAATVKTGIDIAKAPDPYITLPVTNTTNIAAISEQYDCDIKAIYAFNNLSPYAGLSNISEIKVPTMFSNLQDEIDSLENQLYNKKLPSDERAKAEARISLLRNKQALQETLATVYTDGKYVYYTINELGGNVSPELQQKYGHGISVDQLKKIFDIKGSAIDKHNKLGHSFAYNSDYDYFLNFSGNILLPGSTIRVPVRAVNSGNDIVLKVD